MGLTGRTLGVIGAGRIGKELLRMARTFDLKLLAADPYVNAVELGVPRRAQGRPSTPCCANPTSSSSPAVAQRRDAAPDRRAAIRADEAAPRISSTSSRGPVVDEPALIAALQRAPHRRRGARRVRAGAGRPRQSAARDGQRHRHAAFAVLDRRMLPQHGVDRARQHRRRARRAARRSSSSIPRSWAIRASKRGFAG